MKTLSTLLPILVFTILSSSCKKENQSKPDCDFFPVYEGKKVTFDVTNMGNLTPSQYYHYDREATITSNSLRVDEYVFTLTDCSAGKINLSFQSAKNLNFIDNSKTSAMQTIYSDGIYVVRQNKDAANQIISDAQRVGQPNPFVRVMYVEKQGIIYIAELNPSTGVVNRSYKPK